MIRVAALTSGPNVPSTRFRIRQHVGPLRALGVSVREHCPRLSKHSPTPGAYRFGTHRPGTGIYEAWLGLKLLDRATGVLGSWRADVTWLTRNLIPGHATLERLLRRPLVLDVDDAVWLQRPHGAEASRALARRAALVIAGNAFLADYYAGCGAETLVVPTAIDTARFRPPPQRGERERFVIGWTGIADNLASLAPLEGALGSFLAAHPQAELLVVADQAPRFAGIPPRRVRFVPWSPAVEAEAVARMDVGLMPLPDDEWSRGKCSYKMLQYMACGVPALVSPVGMNAEILALGEVGLPASAPQEWADALEHLFTDRARGRQLGQRGREIAQAHFSREVVSRALASALRAVAGRG